VIDRSDASRALAQAIAHKNAGNHDQAAEAARRLVGLLECADILAPDPDDDPDDYPDEVTYTLTGPDLDYLLADLGSDTHELRVRPSGGGIKYSVNGRMWTVPKGEATHAD
jgi:hypothetical protein